MSRSATATLTALGVGAGSKLTTAPARTLPVRGELAELLPWGGLRCGSTVSVRGSTPLLLALVAEATAEGCWAALAGLPECGALAAAELGATVHRLALVPRVARDQSEVEEIVAALLHGFYLAVVATPVTAGASRRLSVRARHGKAVLLPFAIPWLGTDLELAATFGRWTGPAAGQGILSTRAVVAQSTGRGAAPRARRAQLALPGPDKPTKSPLRPALAPVQTTAPQPKTIPLPATTSPLATVPLAAATPLPALIPLAAAPRLPAACCNSASNSNSASCCDSASCRDLAANSDPAASGDPARSCDSASGCDPISGSGSASDSGSASGGDSTSGSALASSSNPTTGGGGVPVLLVNSLAGRPILRARRSQSNPSPPSPPFSSPPGRGESLYTLAVWCPDWSVVAASAEAGLLPHVPTAVIGSGEVVACPAIARRADVRRGTRERAAQGLCPELIVFHHDEPRDAHLFEPVAAAVEELVPGIEVVRPGLVVVPAQGPVDYHGSAEQAAERVIDHVTGRVGVEARSGFANGLFAATLATHHGLAVTLGATREFLVPLDVHVLDQPAERRADQADQADQAELADLLRRLGLRTLAAFAAVPERDVATCSGRQAVSAHRLVAGLEERPRSPRPPPELSVTQHFDPPVDRVDAAVFAAEGLAERLYVGLADRGLACTRLGIRATTGNGEELHRVWRCADPLTPQSLADRVRRQLDGWFTRARLTSGIHLLRLDPEEAVEAIALQPGLWPGAGQDQDEAADRSAREIVHVQGLLGPDAVLTPLLDDGRGPAERVRLVQWDDERTPTAGPDQSWPGQLPPPSPSTMFPEPEPVALLDESGADVVVTGYAELVVRPHRIVHAGQVRQVVAWSGPWPVDERRWDHEVVLRGARLQVLGTAPDGGELAFLLIRAGGKWAAEGVYD